MRKALVVGINHYTHASTLYGCVDDAHAVKSVFERNSDGTINFAVKLLSGTGPTDLVLRSTLREHIRDLFSGESETALFYFAGHGHIETTGGYLIASDAKTGDEGIPLGDVLAFANQCAAGIELLYLIAATLALRGRALQPRQPLNSKKELRSLPHLPQINTRPRKTGLEYLQLFLLMLSTGLQGTW